MKTLFTLSFLFFAFYFTQAQWVPITSPTGNNLYQIDFVNDSVGFIGGGGGITLKTTDGGQNWNIVGSAPQIILRMDFVNDSIGYAVNDFPMFMPPSDYMKTTDGGVNWSFMGLPTAFPYSNDRQAGVHPSVRSLQPSHVCLGLRTFFFYSKNPISSKPFPPA